MIMCHCTQRVRQLFDSSSMMARKLNTVVASMYRLPLLLVLLLLLLPRPQLQARTRLVLLLMVHIFLCSPVYIPP